MPRITSVTWPQVCSQISPEEILSFVTQEYVGAAIAIAAEQGYATIVGTLSCDGEAIAWTEQLAAVYA